MKLRKTVFALLVSGIFAWLIPCVWIQLSYCSKLPEAPDEKTGHTYRMIVNHGFVRYGTERELHILKAADHAQGVAGLLFLSAVVLGLRWGMVKIAQGRRLNE
jgi:hypothetical protein